MRNIYFLVFLLFTGITTTLNAQTWTQNVADINGEYELLKIPTINTQPADLTDICMGDDITFSVVADDAESYQWQRSLNDGSDWVNLSNSNIYQGTTTNTLTVASILGLNNYLFRCILSGLDGDVTSDAARLTFETEDPAIPVLEDVTGECSATATTPTTSDNCAGTVTGTTEDALTYTTQGTHTIKWTFDDGNGNSIDVDQDVVIEDVTDPGISCVSNMNVTADESHTYTVVGAEFDPTSTDDNCEVESVMNDFNSTATLADASLPLGTTTIVWTVTDVAGNQMTCSFDVLVNDYVGMNELKTLGISIYPNPTSGIVKLNFAENNVNHLKVSDISSRTLIEKTELQQNETIDLSGYSSKIYFITVETDKGSFTSKIIRE